MNSILDDLEVVYESEYLTFRLQPLNGMNFVHLDVRKYNKKIKSEILQVKDILIKKYKILFAIHLPEKPVQKHFLELIGAEPVQTINYEGREIVIYRRIE